MSEDKGSSQNGFGPHGGPDEARARKVLAGLRLLVVDDDYVSRMAMERILINLGLKAEGVADGEQAIEALSRDIFDGVLMDVRMAVMDGIEATMRIREGEAGEENRDLPIIAVTAHALEGDRERIMQNGMNGYLSKPFFVEDLVDILLTTFPRNP